MKEEKLLGALTQGPHFLHLVSLSYPKEGDEASSVLVKSEKAGTEDGEEGHRGSGQSLRSTSSLWRIALGGL